MRWWLLLALLSGCLPTPAPSRGAEPAPALDGLDRQVHRSANRARASAGRGPLRWSDDLAAVARAHSRDMARRGYFDHVTPEGVTAHDRARAGGVTCRKAVGGGRVLVGVAENLYMSTRYARVRVRTVGERTTRSPDWYPPGELARRTVAGWLGSPGHRRNLLDATSRSHGIGVATSGDRVLITQVLC